MREEAELVASDAQQDIAVIRINRPLEGWTFDFARSTRLGDDIVALGFPDALDLTATRGIVTATNTTDPLFDDGLLRFDAAVNPGNSGGPLVDDDGRVVGVVILRRPDLDGTYYALPAGSASSYVEAVKSDPVAGIPTCRQIPSNASTLDVVETTSNHSMAPLVDDLFTLYVDGVNSGFPDAAFGLLTDGFQRRSGGQADFARVHSTTNVEAFLISSIRSLGRSRFEVQTGYLTTQDSAFGPSGQTCTLWLKNYELVEIGTLLYIDGASDVGRSPIACEDFDTRESSVPQWTPQPQRTPSSWQWDPNNPGPSVDGYCIDRFGGTFPYFHEGQCYANPIGD